MNTRLITTLICDDVRQESSGKLIVIGLYNRDITFFRERPSPKVGLPKFVILQRWEVKEAGHKCQIDLVDPEGKTGSSTQYELPYRSPLNYHNHIWQILGAVFSPGPHKIRTYMDGEVIDTSEFEVKAVDATIKH